MAEESPVCGQKGRVCRVFWRKADPWVVLRCQNGLLLSLPWCWTDLPIPLSPPVSALEQTCPVLLAPQTLVELVRWVRYYAEKPQPPEQGEKGRHDDSRSRKTRLSPGVRAERDP